MTRVALKLDSMLFNQPVFRAQLSRLVTKAGLGVETTAKLSIQQGTKSGHVYRRKAITRRSKGARTIVGYGFHRASAPGQAPAADTGNLVQSIVARPAQYDRGGISAQVSCNASYGQMLETGTGRMRARPFFGPALKKEEPKLIANVNALLAAAVK